MVDCPTDMLSDSGLRMALWPVARKAQFLHVYVSEC